jgi:putative PIN family toxin of toxin-antitoxin system
LPQKGRRRRPRGVIDTSVLIAGIAGFREPYLRGRNPSADLLYRWADTSNFTWLVSEEILEEYKHVLKRRRVRGSLIGQVINLIRERAELIETTSQQELSPDPKDNCFCACAEQGRGDFIVTLNPKDFPQERLRARVFSPAQFSSRR